ncbi:MAG: crossover junction endodeoxyribonuclease RuvC [Clostridia bacterium]|nr:crossover junction endodeoxyribonuclease RuvC [Clostridia bacterium]
MRILGIDPGIAIVGWGVVDFDGRNLKPVDFGAITTTPDMKTEDRIAAVYREMCAIIGKYAPDAMSVEELFFNTNQKTGIIVAESRGVILLAATLAKVPIYEYTPLQIKQAVVGYGRAEKNQVIAMVTTFLHLTKPPKPDDTADALAAAICHAHSGTSALAALYNKPTTMRGKIDG